MAIQSFLDELAYSSNDFYRSPRRVLRDRRAHCFDGALFAACALRRIGRQPLIMELAAWNDDDHLLAVFRKGRMFGAVAKSNFVGLRYREPIHRSLRELALSYFNDFYNLNRQRTLRSYSALLDLSDFDDSSWETEDGGLEKIANRIDSIRHFRLVTDEMAKDLTLVDDRLYAAGLIGSNPDGLFRPVEK